MKLAATLCVYKIKNYNVGNRRKVGNEKMCPSHSEERIKINPRMQQLSENLRMRK